MRPGRSREGACGAPAPRAGRAGRAGAGAPAPAWPRVAGRVAPAAAAGDERRGAPSAATSASSRREVQHLVVDAARGVAAADDHDAAAEATAPRSESATGRRPARRTRPRPQVDAQIVAARAPERRRRGRRGRRTSRPAAAPPACADGGGQVRRRRRARPAPGSIAHDLVAGRARRPCRPRRRRGRPPRRRPRSAAARGSRATTRGARPGRKASTVRCGAVAGVPADEDDAGRRPSRPRGPSSAPGGGPRRARAPRGAQRRDRVGRARGGAAAERRRACRPIAAAPASWTAAGSAATRRGDPGGDADDVRDRRVGRVQAAGGEDLGAADREGGELDGRGSRWVATTRSATGAAARRAEAAGGAVRVAGVPPAAVPEPAAWPPQPPAAAAAASAAATGARRGGRGTTDEARRVRASRVGGRSGGAQPSSRKPRSASTSATSICAFCRRPGVVPVHRLPAGELVEHPDAGLARAVARAAVAAEGQVRLGAGGRVVDAHHPGPHPLAEPERGRRVARVDRRRRARSRGRSPARSPRRSRRSARRRRAARTSRCGTSSSSARTPLDDRRVDEEAALAGRRRTPARVAPRVMRPTPVEPCSPWWSRDELEVATRRSARGSARRSSARRARPASGRRSAPPRPRAVEPAQELVVDRPRGRSRCRARCSAGRPCRSR